MPEFKSEQLVITDENELLTLRLLERNLPYNGREGKRKGKFFNRYTLNGIIFTLPVEGNERFTQSVEAQEITKIIVETAKAPKRDGKAGELQDAYEFLGYKDESMEDSKLFRTIRREKIKSGDFGKANIFSDLMRNESASIAPEVPSVTTESD